MKLLTSFFVLSAVALRGSGGQVALFVPFVVQNW
jgi:hypothetical protein